MNPLTKAFIGIFLMISTVAVMVWSITEPTLVGSVKLPNLINAFTTVLLGVIPPMIFLIGAFITWLEIDEWKIEQELKREEEQE